MKWALWGIVVFAAATSAKANGELEGQADAITGVNGHSLGGYLATAFTRLFGARTLEVNTFNSAGFSDAATGNIQSEFNKYGAADLANRIEGLAGDDELRGGNMVDTINGGDGNDFLSGEDGNDTLGGGSGNDYLSGSYGNDTYVFNEGDGRDSIGDYGYNTSNTDTLQLGAGLTATDTLLSRVCNDLILTWSGNAGDKVTVQKFFNSAYWFIEKISFVDGTSWGLADLTAKLVQNGTANADSMTGLSDYGNTADNSSRIVTSSGPPTYFEDLGSSQYVQAGNAANDATWRAAA